MTVIATDGGFVNTPYSVETLLITPGERYEVLVNFKQIRDVGLVNLPYPRGRMGIDPTSMGGMNGMRSPENNLPADRSMGGMDAHSNMPGMGNIRTQATEKVGL